MMPSRFQSPSPRRMGDPLEQSLDQFRQTLAADSTGREREWARAVGDALERVSQALRQHRAVAAAPEGLFAEVDAARPELARQTDELGSEQGELLKQIRVLRDEVRRAAGTFQPANETSATSEADVVSEVTAIRQLAEQLLASIEQNQKAETSLVLDSVNTDIGGSG